MKELEVIHLQFMRKMLSIRWSDLIDEKIKNNTFAVMLITSLQFKNDS